MLPVWQAKPNQKGFDRLSGCLPEHPGEAGSIFLKMQYRIFSIPLFDNAKALDELNHFLRANKIVDVKRELVQNCGMCAWTFCITYMADRYGAAEKSASGSKKEKTDYKEVLPPEVFERFVRMRKFRKTLAENDAVPAYAVFTDTELAAIASLPTIDVASMMNIPGIGCKKVEKYGMAFCQQDFMKDEEDWSSDGANS